MALNPKDPAFQKAALGGLLLAALIYANFFTDWLPFTYKASASQVSELESTYRDLSKDLNKARQAAHRLPYMEKEFLLLHRKWEQSQSMLPEDNDMAWCLRTVSLLGAQCGVEFTFFKPLPPKPAQFYTEYPVEVTVVGGYHEVGSFLSEVANLERIVGVDELEIKTPKDRGADHPTEASFLASTYTLGGTGQAPEEEPAPAQVRQGTKSKPGTRANRSRRSEGGE